MPKKAKIVTKTKKKPVVKPKKIETKKQSVSVKSDSAEKNSNPKKEKKIIIEQYQIKKGDTGSPEVQVALLSKRIENLVAHLKINSSDNHSRRGLLGIVSKRRRLLNYLEKQDNKRYQSLGKKLGIRV